MFGSAVLGVGTGVNRYWDGRYRCLDGTYRMLGRTVLGFGTGGVWCWDGKTVSRVNMTLC